VGYVQYLAETGRIPRPIDTRPGEFDLSQEEETVLRDVPFSYTGNPTWRSQDDRALQHALAGSLGRKHEEGAGAAAPYPPLYYALEAIPYKVFSGTSFLDRLLAMRIFSALFAGLTAGFCFLFVRELLPGSPWAAVAAGIAVAFNPLTAFVSGGVNPEALLYAASAAIFWAVARAFRRGLTVARGVGIGCALGVALLTKGTALGFVPGVVVGLAILIWRAAPERRTQALKASGAAVALGALPFLAWLALGTAIYNRSTGTATAGLAHAPVDNGIRVQISYVWQLYLPRLPFMNQLMPFSVPKQIWFEGFVGRFGYNEYDFPGWFNSVALGVMGGLVVLAGTALAHARTAIRRRWREGVAYAALVGGILLSVGIGVYRLSTFGSPVAQARYLLPLLAIYALIIGLAVRALGPRFGPAVGAALAVVVTAHNFAAILLTLSRYYS
jgi:4-amino-4-deoxy-L-arabinose transferase-like glycosyltransferase